MHLLAYFAAFSVVFFYVQDSAMGAWHDSGGQHYDQYPSLIRAVKSGTQETFWTQEGCTESLIISTNLPLCDNKLQVQFTDAFKDAFCEASWPALCGPHLKHLEFCNIPWESDFCITDFFTNLPNQLESLSFSHRLPSLPDVKSIFSNNQLQTLKLMDVSVDEHFLKTLQAQVNLSFLFLQNVNMITHMPPDILWGLLPNHLTGLKILDCYTTSLEGERRFDINPLFATDLNSLATSNTCFKNLETLTFVEQLQSNDKGPSSLEDFLKIDLKKLFQKLPALKVFSMIMVEDTKPEHAGMSLPSYLRNRQDPGFRITIASFHWDKIKQTLEVKLPKTLPLVTRQRYASWDSTLAPSTSYPPEKKQRWEFQEKNKPFFPLELSFRHLKTNEQLSEETFRTESVASILKWCAHFPCLSRIKLDPTNPLSEPLTTAFKKEGLDVELRSFFQTDPEGPYKLVCDAVMEWEKHTKKIKKAFQKTLGSENEERLTQSLKSTYENPHDLMEHILTYYPHLLFTPKELEKAAQNSGFYLEKDIKKPMPLPSPRFLSLFIPQYLPTEPSFQQELSSEVIQESSSWEQIQLEGASRLTRPPWHIFSILDVQKRALTMASKLLGDETPGTP